MAPSNRLQALSQSAFRILGALAFLPPLITRIIVGKLFLVDGWGKWHNFDKVTGFFSDLGIPFPAANAAFISTLELVGGVLLIVGLGTRIFSVLLSSTMFVALLTADRENFVKHFTLTDDLTDVVPVVLLLLLLWLVMYGPGSASVDRWLGKRLGIDTGK